MPALRSGTFWAKQPQTAVNLPVGTRIIQFGRPGAVPKPNVYRRLLDKYLHMLNSGDRAWSQGLEGFWFSGLRVSAAPAQQKQDSSSGVQDVMQLSLVFQ